MKGRYIEYIVEAKSGVEEYSTSVFNMSKCTIR